MNRFAKPAIAVALAALAGPALGQAAGLKPVGPATVAAAAASCAASLTPTGMDEKRLAEDGWRRANLNSKDGAAVDSPLRIYARGNVVMLLTPDALKSVIDDCLLMARIESEQAYGQIVAATQASLKGRVIKEDKGSTSWMLPNRKGARIERTGSADKPAVRVSVIHLPAQ